MEYYWVVTKEVSTAQYCAYGVFDIAGPTEHYQIKWGQAYVGDGGGRKMPHQITLFLMADTHIWTDSAHGRWE